MVKRIVIVEDELIIQEVHIDYLESMGYEVAATFESGEEAIEYFQQNTADLILMDLRLDGSLDGIETMFEIQKSSSIPVVYISGNSEDRNLQRAQMTNMKAFLSKPLNKKALTDVLKNIQ